MIEFKTGNIFESQAQALVNTVNCVGIMGRGLALEFKERYPDNFKAYVCACKKGMVTVGKMFVYEPNKTSFPNLIINFPTKKDWRSKSEIKFIELGLYDLAKEIENRNIKSIAIPPLGCGLGGLQWSKVKILIEKILTPIKNVDILVLEPQEKSLSIKRTQNKDLPMTPGRAALISLIRSYLNGLAEPFITLLEIHKLMYFLQSAGEPLKLKYVKHVYGPYAENLRHVLSYTEGIYTYGYLNNGDKPETQINLLPNAIAQADEYLKNNKDTLMRLNRVSELIEGFESSYGLELLASVDWVCRYDRVSTLPEIINAVHLWNDRKQMFTERQIKIAYDKLLSNGWLDSNYLCK